MGRAFLFSQWASYVLFWNFSRLLLLGLAYTLLVEVERANLVIADLDGTFWGGAVFVSCHPISGQFQV